MSSTVIPTLRYQDAPAAIEFLVGAFGFEAAFVVEGEAGLIDHAQLVLGTGMVMLGSEREGDYDDLLTSDSKASTYVIVSDVADHATRAKAAGAEIVMEPEEQDYGGILYTARDPEGNIWAFGSYDPWSQG